MSGKKLIMHAGTNSKVGRTITSWCHPTNTAERFVLTLATNLIKAQDHSQREDAMSMKNTLSIVGTLKQISAAIKSVIEVIKMGLLCSN